MNLQDRRDESSPRGPLDPFDIWLLLVVRLVVAPVLKLLRGAWRLACRHGSTRCDPHRRRTRPVRRGASRGRR